MNCDVYIVLGRVMIMYKQCHTRCFALSCVPYIAHLFYVCYFSISLVRLFLLLSLSLSFHPSLSVFVSLNALLQSINQQNIHKQISTFQ